jgi:Xaa-Pro aminopeptidase
MIFSFHPNVVIPEQVKEEICGILLVTDKGVENLSKYPPRGMRVV